MPVIAIADIFGLNGRRDELAALLAATERQVRGLAGSRRYVFAARLDAPEQFVLLSEWDTHAAMDAYHRSEQFARYQFELSGLLARGGELRALESLEPCDDGSLRRCVRGRAAQRSRTARNSLTLPTADPPSTRCRAP